MSTDRERMNVDVVIVGAGPAGLSCAIRLKQIAQERGEDLSVCILEKGAAVGAHLLSGAILEHSALARLIPDYPDKGAPVGTKVTREAIYLMGEKRALTIPPPPLMRNRKNSVISLGVFAGWLAEQAEALGVDILPGFAAGELLIDSESGATTGVATGDTGIGRDGAKTAAYQPGIEIRARQVVLAEGCRGFLSGQAISRYGLDAQSDPQTHGLGIKEVWEISPDKHRPGSVVHTMGWPLNENAYGGGFLYQYGENLASVGLVVGLDYRNPYLSPFDEMQRLKTHPKIRRVLEGGRRISYGARVITEGGLQSLPKLSFPGGILIGDAAGFLNVGKIKGIHTGMSSGMIAAEALFTFLTGTAENGECAGWPEAFHRSDLWFELNAVRNVRPGFEKGLYRGLMTAAIETATSGMLPRTLRRSMGDHAHTEPADRHTPIEYPAPDGVLTFDKASSVYLSNTMHNEDQPSHLKLKDPDLMPDSDLAVYQGPSVRYCPAGVYEYVDGPDGAPQFRINAQNCVHCKTCDIKDPNRNIRWTPPEGGDGPNYTSM